MIQHYIIILGRYLVKEVGLLRHGLFVSISEGWVTKIWNIGLWKSSLVIMKSTLIVIFFECHYIDVDHAVPDNFLMKNLDSSLLVLLGPELYQSKRAVCSRTFPTKVVSAVRSLQKWNLTMKFNFFHGESLRRQIVLQVWFRHIVWQISYDNDELVVHVLLFHLALKHDGWG